MGNLLKFFFLFFPAVRRIDRSLLYATVSDCDPRFCEFFDWVFPIIVVLRGDFDPNHFVRPQSLEI